MNYDFSAEYGGVLAITLNSSTFFNNSLTLTIDGNNIVNRNAPSGYDFFQFVTWSTTALIAMQIPFGESIHIQNYVAIDHAYWLYKYVLIE